MVGVGENDFFCTRLTHSLEVAQIGASLANRLAWLGKREGMEALAPWGPPEHLIETACLAHDIGHPAFGHNGEKILNYYMLEFGGFEGNGQKDSLVTAFTGKPTTVTVSRDPAGRGVAVSLLVEEAFSLLPVVNATVGIDVGINVTVTFRSGGLIRVAFRGRWGVLLASVGLFRPQFDARCLACPGRFVPHVSSCRGIDRFF